MKKITIALLIAVIMVLGLGSAVFADGPTNVNINWNGSGYADASVNAGGDSTHSFSTGGSNIWGNFSCTDNNDNPYTYQVDTVSSYIQAGVSEGGAWYMVERQDSKTSMYGAAGQMSYNEIEAYGGWAEMSTGSSCNYAAQKDCTYNKPKTTNGKNFEASADSFALYKWVGNGNPGTPTGNWASFQSTGSGTAQIDCMSSEANSSTIKLGAGCGCYTNSDASFNGVGTFSVNAVGTSGITSPSGGGGWTVPGDGTFGSCAWSVVASYSGNMYVNDYSTKVQ